MARRIALSVATLCALAAFGRAEGREPAGPAPRDVSALLAPIRAELRERVRVAPVERIDVMQAELGPGAGAIGAALWGAERC